MFILSTYNDEGRLSDKEEIMLLIRSTTNWNLGIIDLIQDGNILSITMTRTGGAIPIEAGCKLRIEKGEQFRVVQLDLTGSLFPIDVQLSDDYVGEITVAINCIEPYDIDRDSSDQYLKINWQISAQQNASSSTPLSGWKLRMIFIVVIVLIGISLFSRQKEEKLEKNNEDNIENNSREQKDDDVVDNDEEFEEDLEEFTIEEEIGIDNEIEGEVVARKYPTKIVPEQKEEEIDIMNELRERLGRKVIETDESGSRLEALEQRLNTRKEKREEKG